MMLYHKPVPVAKFAAIHSAARPVGWNIVNSTGR